MRFKHKTTWLGWGKDRTRYRTLATDRIVLILLSILSIDNKIQFQKNWPHQGQRASKHAACLLCQDLIVLVIGCLEAWLTMCVGNIIFCFKQISLNWYHKKFHLGTCTEVSVVFFNDTQPQEQIKFWFCRQIVKMSHQNILLCCHKHSWEMSLHLVSKYPVVSGMATHVESLQQPRCKCDMLAKCCYDMHKFEGICGL